MEGVWGRARELEREKGDGENERVWDEFKVFFFKLECQNGVFWKKKITFFFKHLFQLISDRFRACFGLFQTE